MQHRADIFSSTVLIRFLMSGSSQVMMSRLLSFWIEVQSKEMTAKIYWSS